MGLDVEGFTRARNRLRELTARPVRAGTRLSCAGEGEEFDHSVGMFREPAATGADAVAVWFGDAEGVGGRMERFVEALR